MARKKNADIITKTLKIYAHFDEEQQSSVPFEGDNSIDSEIKKVQIIVREIKNRTINIMYDYDAKSYKYNEYIGQLFDESKNLPIKCPPELSINEFATQKNIDDYIYGELIQDYNYLARSEIVHQSIRSVKQDYDADKTELKNGERSIRSYKKDQPIPINPCNSVNKLYKNDSDYVLAMSIFSEKKSKEFGWKNGYVRFILDVKDEYQEVILKELWFGEKYKMGLCKLAYDHRINHKTKKPLGWYVMISYSFPREAHPALDKDRILGVDLGIVNVLYLAVSGDEHFKKYISGSQINNFKRKQQSRKSDLQRSRVVRGDGSRGHGIKCAMRPAEKQGERVHNFQTNANWHYAHYVIDHAIEQNCGTIQMEDLSGISKDDKQNKMLQHWAFYQLQLFITNLAMEQGIEVRKVKPAHTSQRCSWCGHIDENNRKTQAEFQCLCCGKKTNADWNAARNIATRDIDLIISEEMKAREEAKKKTKKKADKAA